MKIGTVQFHSGILLMFLLLSASGHSQELNIGGFAGNGPVIDGFYVGTIGGTVEYKPSKAILSFNAEPYLLTNFSEVLITFPLFLKFIIGNRFRVCPTGGGLVRTNGNLGWSAGLNFEYGIRENTFLFLRGDFNRDYRKADYPAHFGGSYTDWEEVSTVWLSAGIKFNLLKNEEHLSEE